MKIVQKPNMIDEIDHSCNGDNNKTQDQNTNLKIDINKDFPIDSGLCA